MIHTPVEPIDIPPAEERAQELREIASVTGTPTVFESKANTSKAAEESQRKMKAVHALIRKLPYPPPSDTHPSLRCNRRDGSECHFQMIQVETMRVCHIPCNNWYCNRCAPRKIARLRSSITEIVTENKLTRFMTLTLDPKKFPPNATQREKFVYASQCWNSFRELLARRFRNFRYIGTVELQPQNGNPHFHFFISHFIPYEWIKREWQRCGGGWAVDIKAIWNPAKAAAYVTKYIVKALKQVSAYPDRVRRVRNSRAFVLYKKKVKKAKEWVIFRWHGGKFNAAWAEQLVLIYFNTNSRTDDMVSTTVPP